MKNGVNATFSAFLGAFSVIITATVCSAQALPAETAIPVTFTKTVKSAKAKVGDIVLAKTMQVVLLPDGEGIPKGTLLRGHVVQASGFHFNDADYAVQQASVLAIRFDYLQVHGKQTPLIVSLRALANANDARDAKTPQGLDESDNLGTMVLIGGAHYSPVDKHVFSSDEDDIVGYNRHRGVFARLLPTTYSNRLGGFHCGGTSTEQSVAIFSPDACGLYGFGNVSMSSGDAADTFRLESRHGSVTLYAGSAALLQVVPQS